MSADAVLDGFVERHPEDATTNAIDRLRATDYARLDAQRPRLPRLHRRQPVRRVAGARALRLLCPPACSATPTRPASTLAPPPPMSSSAPAARCSRFLSRVAGGYTAVFTHNCSGALKHIGESFPSRRPAASLLAPDNHNSVNGIREFARPAGAAVELPAAHRAGAAAGPRSLSTPARGADPRLRQPLRVPGAIELHRRAASARSRGAGAARGLEGPPRRGGVRADHPARPERLSSPDFVTLLLLQDLRLSDRRRLPADRASRRAPLCAVPGSPAVR